jgi:hypothetical protein
MKRYRDPPLWEIDPTCWVKPTKEDKASSNIQRAMEAVEQARTNLNKAQARLETTVAKAPKEVADNYRQFILGGGITSKQWFHDGDKKPKQVVPQKRGLRLVVNRSIVRYRIKEDDDDAA